MDGLCQCGCGNPAPIAKRTVTSRGRYKGMPMKFIHGHNSRGMDRSGPRKIQYVEEDRGHGTPCWIWQRKVLNSGYGWTSAKGRQQSAHRRYYEQTNGPIPPGMQVDHLCAVKLCVNPAHMELVTAMENTRRRRATKLTLEQARLIESLAREGETGRALAKRFGVSRQTVDLIRNNGADSPRRPNR